MASPRRHAAPDDSRLRLKLTAAAAAGVVLSGLSVQVVLSGPTTTDTGFAAAARALMVAVPVGVGIYAWHRRPEQRFGPLLVAAGYGWFLTTLAESGNGVLYSIGRFSAWMVELGIVFLVLAFPSGRLGTKGDRALVIASATLVATLYLPTALLVEHYPVPSPYGGCQSGCPGNSFFLLQSEPAWIDSVVRPLRELLTILILLAVTGRVATRVHNATSLMRRTLGPVLAVAIAHALLLSLAVVVRRAAPDSQLIAVLAWTLALTLPALAAAFLLGLLRWRLFIADALSTLGTHLHPNLAPRELRDALRAALDDPSLRLAYWVPANGGGWVDVRGRPFRLPGPYEERCVTEVRDGDRRIAAIVHDGALRDQQELVDAAASYARIALENQHLSAKVVSSLRQIRASRARILAAADEERRRIERDLHDGAQQRLVAMRIKLQLAEELLEREPARGRIKLHALGDELDETLEEIRSLSHGVYPSLLADAGLAEALRAVALRTPIPASVHPDGVGRYSREIESAVYFCCLEAIQNASKHATDATEIIISLADTNGLWFEVRDDGGGFDVEAAGNSAGLTNMHDRLAALGGDLMIWSVPGEGVVVSGILPPSGHPAVG